MSAGVAPSCETVAEICMGSGGQAVCDGSGVMYLCSAVGSVEGMIPCASPRHCQLGKEHGMCALCAPGTSDGFKCEGADLMRCTPTGDGYELLKACETAGTCNPTTGDCTSGVCSQDQKVCDEDALVQCNAGQFEVVETCELGLCDGEAGACDVCVPGEATCEGDSAVVCNGEGTERETTPCPATTSVCVGNGRCVECKGANDCQDPGACKVATCDVGSGSCGSQPAPINTSCMNGAGYCDGKGNCLGCTTDEQCDDPPACYEKACVSGTCEPQPISDGSCCTTTRDCQGAAPACHQWECRSKRCEAVPDDRATCSVGLFAPGICSDGKCVECVADSDCPGAFNNCKNGTCILEDGCGNGRVDSDEECDPSVSGWNASTCDAGSCERKIFETCRSTDPIPCSGGETCGPTVHHCTTLCQNPATDCDPAPPGFSATCQGSACVIPCGAGSSCPPRMTCQIGAGGAICSAIL